METISLARGVPAPECIPVAELADCARAAVLNDGATALSYGSSAGYAPLREWIAECHGVPADRVVVTNGSLQGFVFCSQLLVADGGRVLVEAPTYDRPLKILETLGAEVVAIPQTEEGIDLDVLEDELRRGPQAGLSVRDPDVPEPDWADTRRRWPAAARRARRRSRADGARGRRLRPHPLRPPSTSRPRCSRRRRSTSLSGEGRSRETSNSSARFCAPAATRCSRHSSGTSETRGRAGVAPRAATSSGSISPRASTRSRCSKRLPASA